MKAAGKQVGAVVAAVSVLRLLNTADRPLGVNRIARELGLYPGTCFNILRTLVSERLVTFDDVTKTYRIGIGIIELSSRILQESSYADLLRPGMLRIAETYRLSVALLQIVSRDRMILIDAADSGSDIRIHHRIGSRFPILIGATGHWFAPLSGLSRDELAREYASLSLDAPLPLEAWFEEVAKGAALGYGVDRGFHRRGITAVSVPILSRERQPMLVLTAAGLEHHMSPSLIDAIAADMMATAAEAANTLPTLMLHPKIRQPGNSTRG